VYELAHHDTDDQFGWFAGQCQSFLELFAPSGFIERDHGGHIKDFAQEGMADLGQPGLAFDTAILLNMAWCNIWQILP